MKYLVTVKGRYSVHGIGASKHIILISDWPTLAFREHQRIAYEIKQVAFSSHRSQGFFAAN